MLSLSDLIAFPFYLGLIFIIAQWTKSRNLEKNPAYSYYVKGLSVKVLGGVSLCLIYIYYYGGGFDSTNYFYEGAAVFAKLFWKSPWDYFRVLFGPRDGVHYYIFDQSTGWPMYYRDANAFFLIRIISPLAIITFNSYLATTVLLAYFSYQGMWKLFMIFNEIFPDYKKEAAWGILFIPSVVFWGSGILKDTVVISCMGWFTYCFYHMFIKLKFKFSIITGLVLSIFLVLSLKPYLLYALIPGSMIWYSTTLLKKMENPILRKFMGPFIIMVFLYGGYFFIVQLGKDLGKFSVDKILENAVITQQDLKRDAYGFNSFDIGDFDASIPSMIKKTPIAVVSGLYRPFIYEARNPMMILSGLESLWIIFITFQILLKNNIFHVFVTIRKNPLITFSLIFALFFAFSVGISTSNFGALVRYRIPALPFYVSSLLIINRIMKEEKSNVAKPFPYSSSVQASI